jgi:hypothetical protein
VNQNSIPNSFARPEDLWAIANDINEALMVYSDKDWNYSRISLELCLLESIDSPYVLWIEQVDAGTKQGRKDLLDLKQEVIWGTGHSNELGIAELVSLRVNKAVGETTSDEHWRNLKPVVRLVKKELLAKQGIVCALWYRVREVSGEEFDSR